ncbi:MAG: FKBP-type peptidyl-prolyl cis-trans isomerase, partial [Candidatus Eremiobacterota bacterium]
AEVLTQDEVMPGWIVARQASVLAAAGQTRLIVEDQQPAEVLAPILTGKQDPNLRYAIDFAAGQFLIYQAGEPAPAPQLPDGPVKTASGMTIEVLKRGEGPPARLGALINVHYTGTLQDGTVFDTSRERNQPFQFQLGEGQVIRGWEEGLEGVRVGEVRRLRVPPELAYGDRAVGKIPAGSTLTFEVEVLAPRV